MIRVLSQSWGILLLLAAWQAWVTVTGCQFHRHAIAAHGV